MSRRKPELQTIDVNAWPTVAHTELNESDGRKFEARRQAILRYIAGEPIRAIEKSTNFNRRQLYRWLERAQTTHPDGRPFGFRALIHYVRIAEYARVRDVQVRGERGSRGAAGVDRRKCVTVSRGNVSIGRASSVERENISKLQVVSAFEGILSRRLPAKESIWTCYTP